MAEHKKQHYIPQFYLRNFSSHDERKLINIINIKSKEVINGVSIKKQCYKNYFYGEDICFEKALSVIEKEAAKIIRSMIEDRVVPNFLDKDHFKICMFIILQHTRTLFAKNEMEENFGNLFKNICETHIKYKYPEEDTKEIMNSILIKFKDLPKINIRSTFLTQLLISNLRLHLVVNKTNKDFITSDNPLFTYNNYYVDTPNVQSSGLAFSGLQFFLPLSESVLLCLYDNKVYKYGHKNTDTTYINTVKDVEEINKLQYINCLNNIYFSNFENLNNVEKYKKIKNKFMSRNEFIEGDEEKFGSKISQVVGTVKKDVNINMSLSFMKIKNKLRKIPESKRILTHRDPRLTEDVTEFTKKVKKGEYGLFEFKEYIKTLTS